MKKLISFVMVVCLVLCSFTSWGIVANAAKTVTTTIKNFSSNTILNAEQYGAIREGSYTAVKKSDGWYYKFVRKNQVVMVKLTAFTSSCGNNYNSINNALTKGVMRTDGMYTEKTFTYKKRTTSTNKSTKAKIYQTYIAWLCISANRPDNQNEIDLECYKKSHVQFTYSDRIIDYGDKLNKKDDKVIKPATAKEYKNALARTTSYDIQTTVTPKFTFSITNPGTAKVCLNNYKFEGKGIKKNIDTKKDISRYVEVAQVSASAINSFVSASKSGSLTFGVVKCLFDLGIKAGTLKKDSKSDIYTSNEYVKLSKDKDNKTTYVMSGIFKSPIKLQNYNDFFRTEIKLSLKPNSKTKMQVKFEVV